MRDRDKLHPSQLSTFDLVDRAFPDTLTPDEYFALLKIFEPTEISSRVLGQVLEAIDGRPYAEHYYNLLHELPHRTIPAETLASVQERLDQAGFGAWLSEE